MAALLCGVLGATVAAAEPGSEPTTSGDAKQVWQDSVRRAEIAAEQLNGAKTDQVKAEKAATAAAASLRTAKRSLTGAQRRSVSAAAVVSGYQVRLDAFANASFRGARLDEMSALLTAKTADDFLDQATSLDQVADDTHTMLDQAVVAKRQAAIAATAATSAERAAEKAKADADTAKAAAVTATRSATQRKSDLDAAVSRNKGLYEKLSEQERKAAEEAAELARAESEAAAAAAAAATAGAAAPAQDADQADADSSQSQGSSGASSAARSDPPAVSGGDRLGQIAAAAAMTKIGGGYCYACDGPDSFDCSGLTTWAWAQAGISIPRVSYEQGGFQQVPLDQLEPGDLVTYYSPVSHVAIYVGNGMVVSAADESLGILYVPVERAGPDASGHRVPRG